MQPYETLPKQTHNFKTGSVQSVKRAGKTVGYDGHCLRAFTYFRAEMPDIVDTVESINSIEDKYPKVRGKSKAPTFLLTYQGTWMGLMKNCGFVETVSKHIEANFHTLYAVSKQWVTDKLIQASKDGYVTLAFGLRLRTPVLAKTVLNTKSTPSMAKEESRTAGNALGQSYGLLNNRASIEFLDRCIQAGVAPDIMPIMHVHDSQYFLVRKNIDLVHWFNENLPACMEWQELEEIKHPDVKLGGQCEIYYPNWSKVLKIPNKATKQEIIDICVV